MFNEDKILIAGGTGLIGSACVRQLRAQGFNNILFPLKKEVDYLNYNVFFDYCITNKVKHMIFAAGKVGGIIDNEKNQIDYLLTNTMLGVNALKVSLNAELKKVVLFGSSCMYPLNALQPYCEKDLLSGTLEKTSMGYAVAKLVAMQGANLMNNNSSIKTSFIPVIPNSTFGPFDNFDLNTSHVLSAIVRKIHVAKKNNISNLEFYGTGFPKREFIYSDDVADAVIFLLKNNNNKFLSPINIGSGNEVTIKKLSEIISNIIGYNGIIKFDDTKPDGAKRKMLDSSIINKMGWKAQIPLLKGIARTYEWFLENMEE